MMLIFLDPLQEDDYQQIELTTKGERFLKSFCELWSHLYDLVLIFFNLLSSLCHSSVDHILDAWSIESIKNIADPFFVKMIPS